MRKTPFDGFFGPKFHILTPRWLPTIGESYVVANLNDVSLAYVYFEDEPTRRRLSGRLSSADAKAVAQTIARALTEDAKER